MKKIVVIMIFILLGIWTVSADLSDWLFCSLKKDAVTISLKQTTWYYKCKDTIVSLEHLIVETAKDLMKVQTYLNRWRDIEYRKTVKIEKKALLDRLLLSRTTIVTNMKTFQSNLLQKSIQYFIIKVNPYKISLQKSLVKIQALSGFATQELNAYQFLLRAQVAVIEKLSKVTTQGELTDLLKTYVYLKKEIQWKSE
ncbi:MAG: hypothetical protein ACD_80C00111G0013 [uncultured bacterium (gcode 4)]|uniref:Uncharacterized protein n=1 Tax=uncultured bacterium (gcode 4) TaxID=1234023 RepID=K1XJ42_9BACT|nr:MAG: hypothetical protein ACD_80C00111G0013 [uncultured bacterium (gcode 4)]